MPTIDNKLILDINYKPLPKQSLFHCSDAKYRLYIGAWRAGKSLAGCQEAFKQSYLYPNNCGIIFRKDFTDLRDTTMKTFFEVVPPEFIKDYNKSEHHVTLLNGSEIYFKYLKDGIKLGSLDLGWAFIDEAEEVTEEIFTFLKGRLSRKNVGRNCMWMCSNPPNTDHWLYKNFNDNLDNDHAVFYASTYENKDNLPSDYIASLEKLPESWRKKYLQGQWGFTPDGTPFYQGFIESMHKKSLKYIPSRPIIRSWDYGYHHPACLFMQHDVKGRLLILKETMGSDVTIERFGYFIKTMSREWYPDCSEWVDYGDPAGIQKTDKNEKTSVEILASLGIFVSSKISTYRERKEIIERKFSTLIEGLPSLLIDESCKILIDAMLGGYHYPVRRQGQAYNPNIFELPMKDGFYEHLANCLEYAIVNLYTGAESAEKETESGYKVVGELKDVHFYEEDDAHSSQYAHIIGKV